MQDLDIPAVDLNLLGPLAVLLRERHVSRAAERANVSQSTMSRALAALRRVFDDELLVRAAGEYRLTPRAERLQRDLAGVLPRLETLFSESPFDPLTAGHVFRLAGTDYVYAVLGASLLRRVLDQSPGSSLHFDGWHEAVYRDTERGAVDLAFTGGAAPPPLRSEPLFRDHYVCLMSAEHPLRDRGTLTLADYLECDHVVVDVLGGRQGAIETRLEALGRPRRAGVTVPYHFFAADAVRGTRVVATLPRRFVGELADDRTLAVLGAPEEIATMTFGMAWHPRLDADPAQRWLRESVRAVAPSAPSG